MESAKAYYSIASGALSLILEDDPSNNNIDLGDGFDVEVLDKTFSFRAKQAMDADHGTTAQSATPDGTGTNAASQYEIKMGTETITSGYALATMTFANEK